MSLFQRPRRTTHDYRTHRIEVSHLNWVLPQFEPQSPLETLVKPTKNLESLRSTSRLSENLRRWLGLELEQE
jgi:hypothetical protein